MMGNKTCCIFKWDCYKSSENKTNYSYFCCNIFIFSFHYMLKICFIQPETSCNFGREENSVTYTDFFFFLFYHFKAVTLLYTCSYFVFRLEHLFINVYLLSFKIDFIVSNCCVLPPPLFFLSFQKIHSYYNIK